MALSRSVQKAQSTAICQICEKTTNLKWKCNECDLLFCDKCHSTNLRLHSKIKLLKDHVIIDIKQLGLEGEIQCIQRAQLRQIDCTKHVNQKCSLFCNECAVEICNTCIIENSHRDHALNEISDVYVKKMKILNEMKDETENEIARCIEEESRIKDTFEKGQNEYTVTRNAINKRETELGDILKRYSERLLKKLNTESNMTEKMISSRQTEVAEHRKKLEKKKDSINEILPSQQVLKILKASRTPCEKLMTTKYIYQRKFKQTKVVICQKVTEYTLQNLFGDLYAGPEYKLVQSLKTDLKDISKLLYYEKDRLIFSSVTEELLQQVKIENNDIVVEKQIKDYEVYDMALMKNGMILLSMKSTKLNVWDCEGKLRLFHSFESFYTYGLHVSKENEILVGLSSSNVVSECDRSGKVLVLNSKKHVVKTYEHDTETKQKLFKCPLRIVTNYDKTICVIDVDGSPRNKRRVLCLSQEGTLKWKYEGSNSLNFEPYDLTTTTDGLIFVLDLYRTIHCFDQEGSLSSRKPCHAQSPSNLPFYHTLAIGFEGLLLVGQTNESHTKSEINVYELK